MPVYNVSYDLNKPRQNYDDLIKEIESSPGACHVLESTWMVKTSETAEQLSNRLRAHLDENDNLLVIETVDNKQGWLPQDTWDCINGLFG